MSEHSVLVVYAKSVMSREDLRQVQRLIKRYRGQIRAVAVVLELEPGTARALPGAYRMRLLPLPAQILLGDGG